MKRLILHIILVIVTSAGATSCHKLSQPYVEGQHKDGDIIVVQAASLTMTPYSIVIMPEGYTREEIGINGPFEQRAREVTEEIFKVEPMKSLRGYFNVFIRFYASEDEGVSEEGSPVNTFFGATTTEENPNYRYDHNKAISCLYEVDDPAKSCALIIANHINNGAVAYHTFAEEYRVYASCMIPARLSEKYHGYPEEYLWHECCGHCIGLLADEYTNITKTAEDHIRLLKKGHDYGVFKNVSFSRPAEWEPFIGRKGYENVGYFEGTLPDGTTLYTSEEKSIMKPRLAHFNAISRKLIYDRVMTVAGKPHSLESFLELESTYYPFID